MREWGGTGEREIKASLCREEDLAGAYRFFNAVKSPSSDGSTPVSELNAKFLLEGHTRRAKWRDYSRSWQCEQARKSTPNKRQIEQASRER